MADPKHPFLRGRFEPPERYQSITQFPRDRPPLPQRDPSAHRAVLLGQLARLEQDVAARPAGQRDPEATREIIAVRPESGTELEAERLADRRGDVRAIGPFEESGVVLLDAPSPHLGHLGRKLDEYARSAAQGAESPRNEQAIVPIESIELARLRDLLVSVELERYLKQPGAHWVELACRGGYLDRQATDGSRGQIARVVGRLGLPAPREFVAAERVVLFTQVTLQQLFQLVGMVDCVYEVVRPSEPVRDWLLTSAEPRITSKPGKIIPPQADAPAIALLDSGVASRHPLIGPLVSFQASVIPGDASGEDTHGHGTRMAGIALYNDVGSVATLSEAVGSHWIESVRIWVDQHAATSRPEHRPFWPAMTVEAVAKIEEGPSRPRVFATAVTAPNNGPPGASTWSAALDQIAYNEGCGRVVLVSTGNADWTDRALVQGYPQLNLQHGIDDPSQAMNVVTVGGVTHRDQVAPLPDYASYTAVAPRGGVSPFTRAGPVGGSSAIKPDVVFEAGNLAFDGENPSDNIPGLAAVTTGYPPESHLFDLASMTSEATMHGAWFAAQIQREHRDLSPHTVRGLIGHSARWSGRMERQFRNLDERLAIFGYGEPNLQTALRCARDRATVVLEDRLANATLVEEKKQDEKGRWQTRTVKHRFAKFFRMPFPPALFEASPDARFEVRVTLSYFAEPNKVGRKTYPGMELKWDMQGPLETEAQFRYRINKLARAQKTKVKTKSFEWEVGINRRSRRTLQCDRCNVPASMLAGVRLIAVYPVLGWWDDREARVEATSPFSLIVTVESAGLDVYNTIAAALQVPVVI